MLDSYLKKLSDHLILTLEEKHRIGKSITILKEKIDQNLEGILEHFCFGSYMRGTKLPLDIDQKTDIDYLIVFNSTLETRTELLRFLQEFVKENFTNDEIVQLSPICIVSINHIRFELIPAYRNETYFINYKIPTDIGGMIDWVETVPNEFNDFMLNVDALHHYQILPIIRILKYWNVLNDYVFIPYLLENVITFMDFPQLETRLDYLRFTIDKLCLEFTDIEPLKKLKNAIDQIDVVDDEEDALYYLTVALPYIW